MSKVPVGNKQTEIGVIPEDWEASPLPDIIWFQEGPGLRKWQFRSDGLKIINVTNLQETGYLDLSKTDRHISWEEFERVYKHFLIDDGDVVMASSGNSYCKTSVVRQCDLPLLMNTSVIRFKAKDKICRSFMLIYLKSKYFKDQIDLMITGGAQPNFGPAHLAKVLIPLPPTKAEQESIAEVLSDTDALIESLGQLIAKKRHLKQGTMQELLTGKKRLPGFQVKPGFKKTEIGAIPGDWDIVPFGKLIAEFRGGAPLKPSDFTKSGVKVLPKGGVGRTGWLHIDDSDLQYCSPGYSIDHPRNQVDESFTIIVLRDLVPSGPSIGLMVQIKGHESFVLAQGVYGFKVNQAAVPGYLVQLSNTRWYRKMANSIMVGSTQVHITNTSLKRAQIPLPSVEEQTAITTILSDMDAEIAALETKLAKTRQLKQGMMHNLLTGRIRLL